MLCKLLTAIIRVYQYFLSPLLPSKCRFYPSCSHYAIMALKNYNFLKASMLIFKRLSKCHPWSKADPIDPLK